MIFKKFFSHSGEYVSYRMFSFEHILLLLFAVAVILFLLHRNRKCSKDGVTATIKRCTIFLWCMESVKIIFTLLQNGADNLNTYIPLYYCSLPLYCGFGSVYAKGRIKKLCDIFMMVGGITGGVGYLLFPCTTAGIYPAIHMITLQSFIHHSVMIYLSFLIIKTDYIEACLSDVKYYAFIVIGASVFALVVNAIFGSNLMFVSDYFEGTATEVLYTLCPPLYSILITLIQAFPPYYIIYGSVKLYKMKKKTFAEVV